MTGKMPVLRGRPLEAVGGTDGEDVLTQGSKFLAAPVLLGAGVNDEDPVGMGQAGKKTGEVASVISPVIKVIDAGKAVIGGQTRCAQPPVKLASEYPNRCSL